MDKIAADPEPFRWTSIEELCDHYFGRPSPLVLQMMKPLEKERSEVRDFVRRAVRPMGTSRLGAQTFSPLTALGFSLISMLPGAWGGMVPPITAPGRHKKIDEYLSENRWRAFGPGTVMLDLGCGFPPQTVVDAAKRFPDWQVIGADPSFDPYLLYDGQDVYACLDHSGRVRFFWHQPGADLKAWEMRLRDCEGTVQRLTALFDRLFPELPPDDGEMSAAEADGVRLIRWPLKQWESANLKLVQAGIGSSDLPEADLIRCFNVLVYYDADFRREFEAWAASKLRDNGLLITGYDSPNGWEPHYEVYRKEAGKLVEKEFAFGTDNLGAPSIGPWCTMHDDEPSALRLAHLIGLIRSNAAFCAEFDGRFDELLSENQLLVRGVDGYLAWAAESSFTKIVQGNLVLAEQFDREGFTARAVDILSSFGFHAWRNEVGHVAVDSAGFKPTSDRIY